MRSLDAPQPRRTNTILLAVIATVLVCAALKAAQMVFLPLVLAGFLAMLVQPPIVFLHRYMPKWLAQIIVLTGLAAGFVGIWAFVAASVSAVVERSPSYIARLVVFSDRLVARAHEVGVPVTRANLPLDSMADRGIEFIQASLAPLMSTLGVATLVAFMLVLMLLEVDSFRAKVRRGLRDDDSAEFFATLHSVSRHFQTFFFVKTFISLLTGLLTAGLTYAVGIDFPFIWGTLAFLLNYIPNIGSMIAVIPPVLLALIQFEGPGRAIGTFAGLSLVQMTIGNFFDPRWLGRSLSLSPFVVFATMVFWGWIWGVAGIFLSVPLTILMRIVFEHVPGLRAVALMMGGIDPQEQTAGPIEDEEVQLVLSQTAPMTPVDDTPLREAREASEGGSLTGGLPAPKVPQP